MARSLLLAGVSWFLYRTHAGLVLRSVGDLARCRPCRSAIPVIAIRYAAVAVRRLPCAGWPAPICRWPTRRMWAENMTAGRGWIALALVVFADLAAGAVAAGRLSLRRRSPCCSSIVQGAGVRIPSQFLSMLPYLATIIVLVLISRDRTRDPPERPGLPRQAVPCGRLMILWRAIRFRWRPRRHQDEIPITTKEATRCSRAAEHSPRCWAARPPGADRPRRASLGRAADPFKAGFIYVGPVADFGWSHQHDNGPQGGRGGARRQGEDHLCRERQGRPGCRARDPRARVGRPRHHLHDLLRLHESDHQGGEAVSRT